MARRVGRMRATMTQTESW